MHRGEVIDEWGVAVTPARAHRAGLRVYYYRTIDEEVPIPFSESVLYQDDHLVVADKPHFLPVLPAGRFLQETLLVRLKRKLGINALVPLHRIDSGTAGLVVLGVRPQERDAYQSLFRRGEVAKVYESIGSFNESLQLPMTHKSRMVPDDHFMRMRECDGEPNSLTTIEHREQLSSGGGSSHAPPLARYRLRPHTGRKHQLRVHCASLGIPILNDPMYPVMLAQRPPEERADFGRPLQLLAKEIGFTDPITGELRRFESQRSLTW